MSEELLIRHCSPTLAGLKTGNLFNCVYDSAQQLRSEIDRLNAELNPRGVKIRCLQQGGGRALIYVYRPDRLVSDMTDREVQAFLAAGGYPCPEIDLCLAELSERLQEPEFPHEIGLFLGYPLPDVKAFIANRGRNAKCNGCWKSYTDQCEAERLFARYKKCTDIYSRKYTDGVPLERLTVCFRHNQANQPN